MASVFLKSSRCLGASHICWAIFGGLIWIFGWRNDLIWESLRVSYCSDPSWGGRNYILKWVFFVQSIFAGRYIHRRELRLISLESSSSVEYGIKKIFLIFVLYRELSRFKLLKKVEWVNSRCFIHIFQNFCLIFCQFCLNLLKFLRIVSLILFLGTKKPCWLFWFNFFGQKLWINISKFSLFHQKQHEISYFSPLW